MNLRTDAEKIIRDTLQSVLPQNAVHKALENLQFPAKRIFLVAIGKAAWTMAEEAAHFLGKRLTEGIVITKYDHVQGPLPHITCFEAGHPISDANSYFATKKVLAMTDSLREDDCVLLLVSGGGSALFEDPLISPAELEDVNHQLLASGAGITEINTLRKRISKVKGGKFALHCAPAHIEAIVLSDIIGDPLDMIASGPAYPDSSTSHDALEIVRRYHLKLSEDALSLIASETPKEILNAHHQVTGSVRELVNEAARISKTLGYTPYILTDQMEISAREAGKLLGSMAKTHQQDGPIALIAGGETVVRIIGDGLGGRNQELALSAALEIRGIHNVLVFSVGSDGTDGPTDAAGGIVDGQTVSRLEKKGILAIEMLDNNDSYHALKACDGLVMTGPTGTNVNDFTVVLIQ